MTGYVVTRWYRAPEVIFNWMHYSQTGSNFPLLWWQFYFQFTNNIAEQQRIVVVCFFCFFHKILLAYFAHSGYLVCCLHIGWDAYWQGAFPRAWQYPYTCCSLYYDNTCGALGDEMFSFMIIFHKGIDFFNNYFGKIPHWKVINMIM